MNDNLLCTVNVYIDIFYIIAEKTEDINTHLCEVDFHKHTNTISKNILEA